MSSPEQNFAEVLKAVDDAEKEHSPASPELIAAKVGSFLAP